MAATDTWEIDMPKYLILKHYRGGPELHPNFNGWEHWTPDEARAHLAFQRHVTEMLRETGEYVDGQALSPEGSYVRYGGPDAAPVVDGPFPEAKELIAGWLVVDVDSVERAHEIAAYVSSAPGKGGEPIYEWLEVRPFMDDATARRVTRGAV
jgi:hypothetical protein